MFGLDKVTISPNVARTLTASKAALVSEPKVNAPTIEATPAKSEAIVTQPLLSEVKPPVAVKEAPTFEPSATLVQVATPQPILSKIQPVAQPKQPLEYESAPTAEMFAAQVPTIDLQKYQPMTVTTPESVTPSLVTDNNAPLVPETERSASLPSVPMEPSSLQVLATDKALTDKLSEAPSTVYETPPTIPLRTHEESALVSAPSSDALLSLTSPLPATSLPMPVLPESQPMLPSNVVPSDADLPSVFAPEVELPLVTPTRALAPVQDQPLIESLAPKAGTKMVAESDFAPSAARYVAPFAPLPSLTQPARRSYEPVYAPGPWSAPPQTQPSPVVSQQGQSLAPQTVPSPLPQTVPYSATLPSSDEIARTSFWPIVILLGAATALYFWTKP